jgi:hypothetical protein
MCDLKLVRVGGAVIYTPLRHAMNSDALKPSMTIIEEYC